MKKILISIGIILVAALAIDDTMDRFKELDNMAINTPAQFEMRTPAKQTTGQMQRDKQTENKRNWESNRHWDNNPNNNSSRYDNYNRNPKRSQNRLREYFEKNPYKNDF